MDGKNIAIGIVVIAVIGIAVFALGTKPAKTPSVKSEPQPTSAEQPTQQVTTGSPVEVPLKINDKSSLKDGIYEATGKYTTPGGEQQIGVKLSLKNRVVETAEVVTKAKGDTSIQMQAKFKAGFKEKIVGKSIDAIALTVVNGSSLTPKGFMDALEQIKKQAQQS